MHGTAIGRFTLFGAAGIMAMTQGNVLSGRQRHWAGLGSFGGGWSPLRWTAFKIQANGNTPSYTGSELRELAASPVQLTIAGTLAFTRRVMLDAGVTEDLIVNTSPDVVFHLALRVGF